MFMRAFFAGAIALSLCSPAWSEAQRLVMKDVSDEHGTTEEQPEAVAEKEKPKVRRAPQPFPEFSARRVKVPGSGSAKRITVQIDPSEQKKPLPLPPVLNDPKPPAEPIGKYTWFWDKVSPDMTNTGPGRLLQALNTLNTAGNVNAPRLQAMQAIARAQGAPILRSTVGTSVSPALVLAMIAVESSGRTEAVSNAGAQGLMQLMPDTAARFGVADSMKPEENISGGVKYLDWLMGEFNNDPILVLAGYNAGEGSVHNYAGVPPYAETRDYVPKVLAAFQVASGLCRTPPELITDGCVFVAMN